MSDPLLYVFAFLGAFAFDFVWAMCVRAVGEELAFKAACLAALLALLSGTLTLEFVHRPWMLAVMMAGYFCGTYTSVKLSK